MLIATSAAQTPQTTKFRHDIKPGKIEEECRSVDAGAKVAYHFSSSAPVAFNVHFHHEKEVDYPVKVERTGSEKGVFTAASKQEFCWMWTNATTGTVVVEGELTPMR